MKLSDRICWVSAVGDNPNLGGGVARAVSLIKRSGLIKECNGDFFSLYGMTKSRQVFFCARLLIRGYRQFVVHSFFSPFVLFLLCFPIPITVLIMPHGELKSGALALNPKRKKVAKTLVSFFYLLNHKLKKIAVIATNQEEIALLYDLLPVKVSKKLPDFLSDKIIITNKINYDEDQGINLVVVARMVPEKGIADLLKSILLHLDSIESSWYVALDGIFIFYQEEDQAELSLVKDLSDNIKTRSAINVYLKAGLGPEEIAYALRNVSNRMGFISSRFESFSYALIETLSFEYKPIVWFQNELVDQLILAGLCVRLKYGSIDTVGSDPIIQLANKNLSDEFLQKMVMKSFDSYKEAMNVIFTGKACE